MQPANDLSNVAACKYTGLDPTIFALMQETFLESEELGELPALPPLQAALPDSSGSNSVTAANGKHLLRAAEAEQDHVSDLRVFTQNKSMYFVAGCFICSV